MQQVFPASFTTELWVMLKLTLPISLSDLLEVFLFTVAVMFSGHIGKEELAGVTLGVAAVNVAGFSIICGVNMACDTLFSQTYGSNNEKYLGVLLQKALLINLLLCIFCAVLFVNADVLFLVTGQDPAVAKIAGTFAMYFSPILPMFCIKSVLSKYLFSQNIVAPTLATLAGMSVTHVLLMTVFVYCLQLKTIGIILSLACTFMLGMVVHIVYIFMMESTKRIWPGWSYEALDDWGSFCSLAVSGCVMICAAWWTFEIFAFLAGLLGKDELGTHGIAFQVILLMGMIGNGLSTATSVRVGNLLGNGDLTTAKRIVLVVLPIFIGVSILHVSILIAGRYVIPRAYTSDGEIISLFATVTPVLAVYAVVDCSKFIAVGLLAGMGRQFFAAMVNVVIITVSVPVGYLLMFKTDLRLKGAWVAILLAEVARAASLFARYVRVDWTGEIKQAQLRASTNGLLTNNTTAYTGYLSVRQDAANVPLDENIKQDRTRAVNRVLFLRGMTFGGAIFLLLVAILVHTFTEPFFSGWNNATTSSISCKDNTSLWEPHTTDSLL